MPRLPPVICLLLLMTSTLGAADATAPDPTAQRAFTDLAALYAHPSSVPFPTDETLDDLDDPTRSATTATYVLDLLQQALADETNGRGRQDAQPDWEGNTFPYTYHGDLAARLARTTLHGPALVPIALWLIEQDPYAEDAAAGMTILRRLDDPALVPAFRRILATPHPCQAVLVGALEETAKRHLTDLAPEVAALCAHHRAAVRAAAAATAKALGVADLPPYLPDSATTPALTTDLAVMETLLLPGLPAPAAFGKLTVTWHNPGPRANDDKRDHFVWFLAESPTTLTVEDLSFTTWIIPTSAWKPEGNYSYRTGERGSATVADAVAVFAHAHQDLAQANADERAAGHDDDRIRECMERTMADEAKFSCGGPIFLSHFDSNYLSMAEIGLALWCHVHADDQDCWKILLPRLDVTRDDRALLLTARTFLGHRYHIEMVEAFAGRDYARALLLAHHLSQPCFDGYEYQDRAKRLAADLPTRMDDFRTFTLPSPESWSASAAAMTRREQIAFLTDHLRLLNCFQMMQPGGVSYDEEQTLGPRFSATGSRPAINPSSELDALKLTPGEIPLLLPGLTDDRYIPTYSYHRDFFPGRTLHQVNWVVAEIINRAAHAQVVDMSEFQGADPAKRQAILAQARSWCAKNAGLAPDALIIAAIDGATSWRAVLAAGNDAANAHLTDAVPHLIARQRDFAGERDAAAELAHLCYRLGGNDAVTAAGGWLDAADTTTRAWAGATVLIDGDAHDPNRAKAIAALHDLIAADHDHTVLAHLGTELVASGQPAALDLAAIPFADPACDPGTWEDSWVFGDLAHDLIARGNAAAGACMLAGLDDTRPSTSDPPVTPGLQHIRADDFANLVRDWNPDLPYSRSDSDAERAKQRQVLRGWLRDQIDLIHAGKPAAIAPSHPVTTRDLILHNAAP